MFRGLKLGGTGELLKRSMGTPQKEKLDMTCVQTVFHGSVRLKMKERPSRPTRAPGSLAWWFLPGPPLQNMRALPAAAVRRCHYPPPPPLLFTSLLTKAWPLKYATSPPPPHPIPKPQQHPCFVNIESFCNRPTLILIF